jgi:HPt (histidine-containing phosphotransfer) domain-containing protein
MPLWDSDNAAFGRPGGEATAAAGTRPIDLMHLARQTLGDRAVEQDVLSMFAHQAAGVAERIGAVGEAERLSLAHTLKGSARAIGAFAVADCAAEIEARPEDGAALERLRRLIDEARDFISAISR